MLSNSEIVDVQIQVDMGPEVDANRLDESTRSLRNELRRHVEQINFNPEKTVPAGTRSTEASAIGELALEVLPAVLPLLIQFFYDWCLRAKHRSVEIEIRRTGQTSVKLKITGDIPREHLKEIISSIQTLI